MDSRTPIVSVFIPTRNRAHMLRDSIDSVLRQTFKDFELIISDNASDDATESLVRSLDDRRIRYFRNDHNIGQRGNWNRGFSLAKGEYITFLSDDEEMHPQNLERKVSVLSSNPRVGLVHSKFDNLDGDGRIIRCNMQLLGPPDRTTDSLENRLEVLTTGWDVIACPTALFRRACYERLGTFSERLDFAFDYEYWMRIAVYYDVAFLATPLIRARVHNDQATMKYPLTDKYFLLREDILSNQLITRNHLDGIPDGYSIKKEIWRRMGQRFEYFAAEMQKEGWSRARLANLFFKTCLEFPELLRTDKGWKVLVKSLLGKRGIIALKQLYTFTRRDSISS